MHRIYSQPKFTIPENVNLIAKTPKEMQHAHFSNLLEDKPTRLQIVVTFLALLELIKRYRVEARQEELFSGIEIDY